MSKLISIVMVSLLLSLCANAASPDELKVLNIYLEPEVPAARRSSVEKFAARVKEARASVLGLNFNGKGVSNPIQTLARIISEYPASEDRVKELVAFYGTSSLHASEALQALEKGGAKLSGAIPTKYEQPPRDATVGMNPFTVGRWKEHLSPEFASAWEFCLLVPNVPHRSALMDSAEKALSKIAPERCGAIGQLVLVKGAFDGDPVRSITGLRNIVVYTGADFPDSIIESITLLADLDIKNIDGQPIYSWIRQKSVEVFVQLLQSDNPELKARFSESWGALVKGAAKTETRPEERELLEGIISDVTKARNQHR